MGVDMTENPFETLVKQHRRLTRWTIGIVIYAIVTTLLGGLGFWYSARADVTAACKATNNLREQIYIAALDAGASPALVQRFITDKEDCSLLP